MPLPRFRPSSALACFYAALIHRLLFCGASRTFAQRSGSPRRDPANLLMVSFFFFFYQMQPIYSHRCLYSIWPDYACELEWPRMLASDWLLPPEPDVYRQFFARKVSYERLCQHRLTGLRYNIWQCRDKEFSNSRPSRSVCRSLYGCTIYGEI